MYLFSVLRLTLEAKVPMEVEETEKDNARYELRRGLSLLLHVSVFEEVCRCCSHVSYAILTCKTFILIDF